MIPIFFLVGVINIAEAQVDSTDYKFFKYPNGVISSEGYMQDGKPNLYWKTYYEDGVLKTEGNRENFELTGPWKFYDELGNLRYIINYKSGKKDGLYERFVDSVLVETESYEADLKQGLHSFYYETGVVEKEIPYEANIKSGTGYQYAEDGTIIAILTYAKDYLKKLEKINRLDKIGRKQGVWKSFYDDMTLKSEGVYVDGEKYGMFRTFDEDGKVTSIEHYKNGVLDTESPEAVVLELKNEYGPGGKIIASGSYKDGKKHGTHRNYDDDGNIIKSYIYEDGVKVAEGIVDKSGNFTGPWQLFYPNGKLKAKGTYEGGKRIEDWVFYFENGKELQKGKYKDGKPHGNWRWYFENGELRRNENYRKGYEEGESVEYDENGELIGKGEYLEGYKEGEWYLKSGDHIEKGSYVEGERDGDWIYEYESGALHFKGEYQRGLAIGKHKYYYESGQVKKEGKYNSGLKTGSWKHYKDDGELLLTIEYNSGIEVKLEGTTIKPTYQELGAD